VGFN